MSPEFFPGPIDAECLYGLLLNARRCQSIAGAQLFRTMFYLDKLDFHRDHDIADALSPREEDIRKTIEFYESMYRSSRMP